MSFAVAAKKPCGEDDAQMGMCMMENLSDQAFEDITQLEGADQGKAICDNMDVLEDCFDSIGLFFFYLRSNPDLNPRLNPNPNPNS